MRGALSGLQTCSVTKSCSSQIELHKSAPDDELSSRPRSVLFSHNKGTLLSHPPFASPHKSMTFPPLFLEHPWLSAERVALDRSFYSKTNLPVLGGKSDKSTGPGRERSVLCSPGLTGFRADQKLKLLSWRENLSSDIRFAEFD